jgi:hypothetical protein
VIIRRHRLHFLRILGLSLLLLLGFAAGVSAQEQAVIPDTNVGRWSFLVGTFLPLAIATVNRQRWTSQAKGVMTFALSALAATGTSYFAGELTATDLVTSLLIILVSATVTYTTFWKPSGIAETVEERTG